MAQALALPPIRPLIDPLLGKTPAQLLGTVLRTPDDVAMPCWPLVRFLLLAGLGFDIEASPEEAAQQVCEVWWRDDPRLPTAVVQPWDLVLLGGGARRITTHVCLAIDTEYFLHIRRITGVVAERYRRWAPYLLQLARLRRLA